jgi:hypothetical protein
MPKRRDPGVRRLVAAAIFFVVCVIVFGALVLGGLFH